MASHSGFGKSLELISCDGTSNCDRVGAFINSFDTSFYVPGNFLLYFHDMGKILSYGSLCVLQAQVFILTIWWRLTAGSPHYSSPIKQKQSSWAKFGTTPCWLNHVSHNLKHYSHILDTIITDKENQSQDSNISFVGTSREASQPSHISQILQGGSHNPVHFVPPVAGNISSSSSEFTELKTLSFYGVLTVGVEKGLTVQLSPNKSLLRYYSQPFWTLSVGEGFKNCVLGFQLPPFPKFLGVAHFSLISTIYCSLLSQPWL